MNLGFLKLRLGLKWLCIVLWNDIWFDNLGLLPTATLIKIFKHVDIGFWFYLLFHFDNIQTQALQFHFRVCFFTTCNTKCRKLLCFWYCFLSYFFSFPFFDPFPRQKVKKFSLADEEQSKPIKKNGWRKQFCKSQILLILKYVMYGMSLFKWYLIEIEKSMYLPMI